MIQTVAAYDLIAGRKAQYTGVWVGNRKIAAIGVSVRHWITGHGFALNVQNDLELFKAIVPCGIEEFGVTSLQKQGVAVDVKEVAAVLSNQFTEVFTRAVEARSDTHG